VSPAQQYNTHHFACPVCIAAGRGEQYGQRCADGLKLWNAYQGPVLAQIAGAARLPSRPPMRR